MLNLPRIRPLSEEADIDFVVMSAGGKRAHPDEDRRALRNSDYLLGNSIIELKLLEDERLDKPEAQAKIAKLFRPLDIDKPVIVVDPTKLDDSGRRTYANIMRAPIKNAVRSASGQLKQTKSEIDPSATTVMLVINNGLTTMGHEELLDHVVGRAKNDTNEIDAVVVAGCYLHSDGFDTYALWPIDCVTMHSERPFREFETLRECWNDLAERHMTEFVQGKHGQAAGKVAQMDAVFNWDGRTYVKPAVSMGAHSEFYGEHRPRRNSVTFNEVEGVAVTVPCLSQSEYRRIRPALRDEPLLKDLETWNTHIAEAMATGTPDKPVVPIDISRGRWEAWKRRHPDFTGTQSLRHAANEAYGAKASRLVHAARDAKTVKKLPRRFVWVQVELIGQDEKNDLAHIGYMMDGNEEVLATNLRMGHYQALALAAAHAIRLGLTEILWNHDLRYAWV
ncbi:hypothetical protein [Ciceribacter thiooxidans]|uniref:Uncharacterized protein n=1 Tax=Ciceribacter thiooxidans TaxID=1969821 RepID=A0ABV7ICM4_9HYPH|nr:hypothetical protein [Ciceribacter thiooxidans]